MDRAHAAARPLTIELVGVHAVNKGAVLMLESAVEMLRERLPEARLVGSLQWPADLRRRLKLKATRPSEVPLRQALRFALLPSALKKRAGMVPRGEIDVILDISGFAYGDDWPLRKLQARLLRAVRSKKDGRPLVILMPQAFGPFASAGHAAAMAEALQGVDQVFARDAESLGHLQSLKTGAFAPLELAPDFTNLLNAATLAEAAGELAYIIPNQKLVRDADPVRHSAYLTFLGECAGALRDSGLEPRFLIHEGDGDRALAEEVNATLQPILPIVEPGSAVEAKRLIAASRCIVSSRYHGLVSALSSGVPALACGWSHKYAALMRDYGLERLQADLAEPATWRSLINELAGLGEPERNALLGAAQRQKEAARAMWDKVFALIAHRRRDPDGSTASTATEA